MDGRAEDFETVTAFFAFFLGTGNVILSASPFFVPVDMLGYTGFGLTVDVLMIIPFVGCLRELLLRRRMRRTVLPTHDD